MHSACPYPIIPEPNELSTFKNQWAKDKAVQVLSVSEAYRANILNKLRQNSEVLHDLVFEQIQNIQGGP